MVVSESLAYMLSSIVGSVLPLFAFIVLIFISTSLKWEHKKVILTIIK